MPETWVMEALGQVLYHFDKARPLLPTYLHLIASAVFPIYAGAHASLYRPVSAAKSPKQKGKDDRSRTGLQIEEETQLAAGFEMSDVLMYPLLAGGMLTGLYYLINYLEDVNILNTILNAYLSIFGLFGVASFLGDSAQTVFSYALPERFFHDGRVWSVDGSRRLVLPQKMSDRDQHPGIRTSPLPPPLSSLPLPESWLWALRDFAYKPAFILDVQYLKTILKPIAPTAIQVNAAVVAVGFIAYFNLVDRPWWMTNLLGFSFTYSAFQMMTPTRFDIGSGLLSALFFYDIYMVFFTPMMITVASKLDIPAKLVFPRPEDGSGKTPFAMLGLGDVVIPGIMIAFALRYDLFMFYLRKQKLSPTNTPEEEPTEAMEKPKETTQTYKKAIYARVTGTWGDRFWLGRHASGVVGGNFPKAYFHTALVGYVIGLVVTLGVMQVYNHGQPALLYLVPGVLGAIWTTALYRGEIKVMLRYTEDTEDARSKGIDSAVILMGNSDEGTSQGKEEALQRGPAESESPMEDDIVVVPREKLTASSDPDAGSLAQKSESDPVMKAPEADTSADAKSEEKASDDAKNDTDEATPSEPKNRRFLSIAISFPPLPPKRNLAPKDLDSKRFADSFVALRSLEDVKHGEPAGKRRRLS